MEVETTVREDRAKAARDTTAEAGTTIRTTVRIPPVEEVELVSKDSPATSTEAAMAAQDENRRSPVVWCGMLVAVVAVHTCTQATAPPAAQEGAAEAETQVRMLRAQEEMLHRIPAVAVAVLQEEAKQRSTEEVTEARAS